MNDVSLKTKLGVLSTSMGFLGISAKFLQSDDPNLVLVGVIILAMAGMLAGLSMFWIMHQSVKKAFIEALRERELE